MSKVDLRLDWCSHAAAKFAVEHWHYTKTMPSPYSKPVKIGVWEDSQFIGVVIFTTGVSSSLASPYGLKNVECCELQRVALNKHIFPVSKIVSIAICLLKTANPGLRLIVSFADPHQQHAGTIYQAGNWLYAGTTSPSEVYVDKSGRQRHPRNVRSNSGYDMHGVKMYRAEDMAYSEYRPGKYRYLYPLDNDMRKQIEPLAKPYPKRANEATQDAPGVQPGKGDANSTRSLESDVTNGRP